MIPTKNEVVNTVGGGDNSATLDVDVTDRTFRLLLDGLYTDKPQSICRELWTNALDAHIEADLADKPFHCQLPTELDPTFRVRDYGISMTDEYVMNEYSHLMRSPKLLSNKLTGMLGIGSKSPLSYTDAYTLITFSGTEKRTYLIAMGGNGIPELTRLAVEDCGEPRGVEVNFAVKNRDIQAFRTAAQRVVRGFDVQPTVNGVAWSVPEALFEVDNISDMIPGVNRFRIFDRADRYTGKTGYVRQGPVLYPIPADVSSLLLKVMRDHDFVIDVPLGSVDFTGSREALQLTDRTETYLTDTVTALRDTLLATAVGDVTEAGSRKNALAAYREWDQWLTMPVVTAYNMQITTQSAKHITLQLNGPTPTFVRLASNRGTEVVKPMHPQNVDAYYSFGANEIDQLRFVIDDGSNVPRGYSRFKNYASDNFGRFKTYMLRQPTPSQIMRLVRVLGLEWNQLVKLKDLEDTRPAPSHLSGPSFRREGIPGVYVLELRNSYLTAPSRPTEMPEKYYWLPISSSVPSTSIYLPDLQVSTRFNSLSNQLAPYMRAIRSYEGEDEVLPIVLMTERPLKKYNPPSHLRFDTMFASLVNVKWRSDIRASYAAPRRSDFECGHQTGAVWEYLKTHHNLAQPKPIVDELSRYLDRQRHRGNIDWLDGLAGERQKKVDEIKKQYPLIWNPTEEDMVKYMQKCDKPSKKESK